MNYIIKSEEMPWQPKFFPHEEFQYGEIILQPNIQISIMQLLMECPRWNS